MEKSTILSAFLCFMWHKPRFHSAWRRALTCTLIWLIYAGRMKIDEKSLGLGPKPQGYALVYILRTHPGYGTASWEYRELGEQLQHTLNHSQSTKDSKSELCELLCPIVQGVICPEAEPVAPGEGHSLLAGEGQQHVHTQHPACCLQVGSIHPSSDLQREEERRLLAKKSSSEARSDL